MRQGGIPAEWQPEGAGSQTLHGNPPAQPQAAASLVTHPKRGSSGAICDAAGRALPSQVSRWQVEQSCPSLGKWLQGHSSVPAAAAKPKQGWGGEGCSTVGIAAKPCCLGICSFVASQCPNDYLRLHGNKPESGESSASWFLGNGVLRRACAPAAAWSQGFGGSHRTVGASQVRPGLPAAGRCPLTK